MRQQQYIRDASGLQQLVEHLAEAPRIALDTEFMRERTYYAKLCLVQVATPEVLAAVDPLAIEDLRPLWDVVNGGAEVVLHAASQDLEIIAGLSGAVPQKHFDTQVAAAFLGYGDSIGYARLMDRVIGRTPGRSEAYTDWTRRPLSQDQTEYALDDVRYLLEIADVLEQGLRDAGREGWVREELTAVAQAVKPEADPDTMWRRVKGARSLQGKRLAALRGLPHGANAPRSRATYRGSEWWPTACWSKSPSACRNRWRNLSGCAACIRAKRAARALLYWTPSRARRTVRNLNIPRGDRCRPAPATRASR